MPRSLVAAPNAGRQRRKTFWLPSGHAMRAPRWQLRDALPALRPPQLLQRPRVWPDFRHVSNLIAVELHHIHVVGFVDGLSGWGTGSVGTGMRASEDAIGAHIVALVINGERLNFVLTVRKNDQQALHPVSVLLEGADVCDRAGLRGEGGVWP